MSVDVRGIFLKAGLIPKRFLPSTDIKLGNFRLTKDKTMILLPKAPGYRKYVGCFGIPDCEIEYHVNQVLKERG